MVGSLKKAFLWQLIRALRNKGGAVYNFLVLEQKSGCGNLLLP